MSGDFVYILDDDDYLTDLDFIKNLKKIVKDNNPSIIICKGHIGEKVFPHNVMWKRMNPMRGTLGSPNFIVSKKLFLKYSKFWDSKRAGDYFFINAAFKCLFPEDVFWWDKVVFNAPVSRGEPEIHPTYQSRSPEPVKRKLSEPVKREYSFDG